MRLMIDTNIILDVLLRRDPFFTDSREVLKLCEERRIQGFISASAITDIFYITREALGSVEDTYRVINAVLNIVRILTVTNTDVLPSRHTVEKMSAAFPARPTTFWPAKKWVPRNAKRRNL